MEESATRFWTRIFKNAGLPENIVKQYVKLFIDNRIKKDHLTEINKPVLKEIGITAAGDIIAVLQQIKKEIENGPLIEEKSLSKSLSDNKPKAPVSKVTKKESKNNHTVVEHAEEPARNEREVPAKIQKKSDQPDIIANTRSVHIKTTNDTGTLKRTVFDRLGSTVISEKPNKSRVLFTPDTKEEEVTSTTSEQFPKLESDKLLAKQREKPLSNRLGNKNTAQIETRLVRRLILNENAAKSKIHDTAHPSSLFSTRMKYMTSDSSVFSRLGKRKAT